MDWITVGLGFFAGIVGALMGNLVFNGFYWAELQLIKRQVNAAWGKEKSAAGVQARDEITAQVGVALQEAAVIVESADEPKKKAADIMRLGIKYPRAAGALMREIKKSGLVEEAGLGELM